MQNLRKNIQLRWLELAKVLNFSDKIPDILITELCLNLCGKSVYETKFYIKHASYLTFKSISSVAAPLVLSGISLRLLMIFPLHKVIILCFSLSYGIKL